MRIMFFFQSGVKMKYYIRGQISAVAIFSPEAYCISLFGSYLFAGSDAYGPSCQTTLVSLGLELGVDDVAEAFKPIQAIPLVLLIRKVLFLMTITPAKRVLELVAFL